MQGDTPVTIIGNLVDDPELRHTSNGTPVANGRVASTPRRYDSQTNQWVDAEPLFLSFNVWRQAAENVVNSVRKGDRVVVTGMLRQRSFETREGEKRTVYEIEAEEVAPSLKFATAVLSKTYTQNSQQNSQQGSQQHGGSFPQGDDEPPW